MGGDREASKVEDGGEATKSSDSKQHATATR